MRGRLINPFLAEIARLDQQSTFEDPDGGGPLTSGYDDVYREAALRPAEDRIGTDTRVEWPAVLVPAQFHTGPTPGMLLSLKETVGGDVGASMVQVLVHFKDLEEMGLIDPVTQNALLKVGDRLNAVYQMDMTLVQEIMTPPGLYCVRATPIFGMGGTRNLLELSFEGRAQGQAEG